LFVIPASSSERQRWNGTHLNIPNPRIASCSSNYPTTQGRNEAARGAICFTSRFNFTQKLKNPGSQAVRGNLNFPPSICGSAIVFQMKQLSEGKRAGGA